MGIADDFDTERQRRDRQQKGRQYDMPRRETVQANRRAASIERFNKRQAVNDAAAIASTANGGRIVDARTGQPSTLARTPEERAQQERFGRFLPRVGRGAAFVPEAIVRAPLGGQAMRDEFERVRRQNYASVNGSTDIDPETGESVYTMPTINATAPRPSRSLGGHIRHAAENAEEAMWAAPGAIGGALKGMFIDTPVNTALDWEEAGTHLERGDKQAAIAPSLRGAEGAIYTGLNAELGVLGVNALRNAATRSVVRPALPRAGDATRVPSNNALPLAALGGASALGAGADDAEAQAIYRDGAIIPPGPLDGPAPNEGPSFSALGLAALGAIGGRYGGRLMRKGAVREAEEAVRTAPMGRGGRVPETVRRSGANASQPGPFEYAAQRAGAERQGQNLAGDLGAFSGGAVGGFSGALADPNVSEDERLLYALGGGGSGLLGSRFANEVGPYLRTLPRSAKDKAIVRQPTPQEVARAEARRAASGRVTDDPGSLRRSDPLIEGENVRRPDPPRLRRDWNGGEAAWTKTAPETVPSRGAARPVSPQEVNARVRARQSAEEGSAGPFPSRAYAPKETGPIPRVQYRYEKYQEPDWWTREPAWRRRIREEGGAPALPPAPPKKPRTGLSPSSLRARVGNAGAIQQVPEAAAKAGHALPAGKSAAETMRNIKARATSDASFKAWLNKTYPAVFIALGLGASGVGGDGRVEDYGNAR